jgi:hypothetical protein
VLIMSHMKEPRPRLALALIALSLAALAAAAAAPEYDTGRPQPAVNGVTVTGSGLALSRGHVRGAPAGELAGWTASLWFQLRSTRDGTIFGLEPNPAQKKVVRLMMHGGKLVLTGPVDRQEREWRFETEPAAPPTWNHVAVTYMDEIGLAFYLNGRLVDAGTQSWLGYAVSFQSYFFGGELDEDGAEVRLFDGSIDDFALFNQPFTAEKVARLHGDERFDDELIVFHDFENVDHRSLARFDPATFPEDYLQRGRQLFELHCVACHSKDGVTPAPNPLTRSFIRYEMLNGGDPYRMFRTLTYGYRNMMAAPQLSPAERYQVIHYLRERVIEPNAPDLYVRVDATYTVTMPTSPTGPLGEIERIEELAGRGYLRDYGGAVVTPVMAHGGSMLSRNALVIDLGSGTTIGYDLGSMRTFGAWTGGFLDFRSTLHHRLRAAGRPLARFAFLPGFGLDRWAWDGRAENPMPELPHILAWPEDQVRYGGHFFHGDDVIILSTVRQRTVFESPVLLAAAGERAEAPVIARRFTVLPAGNAIELVVAEEGAVELDGARAVFTKDDARLVFRLQNGGRAGATWRIGEGGKLVLAFEGRNEPIHAVLVHGGDDEPVPVVTDVTTLTNGGPRRWTETHTMRGSLGVSEFQDYVLDSVPVPLKNAYNTWMRTSSLAFFPDGRLAVGTLSGDIWIVDGIDDGLQNVTWRRFAAGLYEPMGLKVVDGVLTAITRGRIVKLHDLNGNGEADFIEAFFNEAHQDPGWHAYNFDLEVGEDGSYYFAKTGGFGDWTLPGGLIKVSPDGRQWELLGAGMRAPNGIGRLPDGRITFGDNQGTWVPASKIAIASTPGSFLGAGNWKESEVEYDPAQMVRPIVHMPQELDSSSGAQLWVAKDERFGPLSGRFYHTSYGRARTMIVMLDEFGDTFQGAVFPLPLTMESGTMRLAVNPVDRQLYFSGMTGWQSGATREGSIQRMRYRGTDTGLYLLDARARAGRLELEFNRPLDPAVVDNVSGWRAEAWNYIYSEGYGSPHVRASNPAEQGTDVLAIDRLGLSGDGLKLTVHIGNLRPCHTLRLNFEVSSRESGALRGPLYFTIHELPE